MDSDSIGQYSYRRGIAFSTAASIVARALTFLTAVAIAYRFGSNEATDVYFYCYLLVTALAGFVSVLDGMVVIPEVMRLQVRHGQEAATRFANSALYAYAVVSGGACVLAAVMPLRLAEIGSRFATSTLEANRNTIVLAIPLLWLMVIGQYLVDLLASQRYFTVPMLSQAANSLLALVAVLVVGDRWGVEVIPLAFIAGFLVQIVVLVLLMRRRFAWRFSLVGIPDRARTVTHVVLSQAANVATLVGTAVPSFLMSGLYSGLLTALQYGQRTAELPNVVLTTQFSSVVGIKFNDLAARADLSEMDRTFSRSNRVLVAILLPIATILSVFAPETVRVLYGRGQFDAEAVTQTSSFLRGLALTLPFLAVNAIVSRLTMAFQRVVAWSWFIIGSNLARSLWVVLAVGQLGAMAYAPAMVLFYIGNTLVLLAYMRRFHPEVGTADSARIFVELLLPTLVMVALLVAIRMMLTGWPDWVRLAVGIGVYGAAALTLPRVFLPFPEAQQLAGRLLRRDGRRSLFPEAR